ncbi:hypothetical protein VNI00_012108 [Paramarasmius palmivorus]|uniref:RRM domain-containing protein n=1 Tax=Paramarasmius palmivorus TaxID=297713 RepID=A0AAW0C4M1_9AGAR
MSDLDADLYGDLYEHESSGQVNNKEVASPAMEESKGEKPADSPPRPASAQPIRTATIPTFTQPEHSSLFSTIAPPTQHIPTYEDNQDQTLTPRAMSAFQSIPVTERSVRPSEMKDEGTPIEGLRDYFEQFGKVEACTIMRDPTGRSRCFAFLTFEDPASVNRVMVQEHFLDGKIIDPKRAIPRQEHQKATKLFIGGLPGTVTSESMREFFSQYGKVVESTVMLDQKTGRSKGFGFISFENTDVQPFLGFGNLEIDGKLIDVKLAQPRYQREALADQDGVTQGDNFTTRAGHGGGFNSNFNGNVSNPAAMNGGANMPFDPQALATLYTRMFQMANNGMNNMAMMNGGMNPMGGMMNRGMGNMPMNMMNGNMGILARGGPGMMQGGGMAQNIPKGPRGATPNQGTVTPPAAGVGPQRAAQRGQHSFHPYSRP